MPESFSIYDLINSLNVLDENSKLKITKPRNPKEIAEKIGKTGKVI